MASFYSVLGFLAVNSVDCQNTCAFDMLSTLPLEMAITVLRLLPSKDLLNAACVSTKWQNLCKSDRKLRQKIRRYIRYLKRARLALIINESIGRNNSSITRGPPMRSVVNTTSNNAVPVRSWISGIPRSNVQARYMPYNYDMVLRSKTMKQFPVPSVNSLRPHSNARLRM